MVRPLLEIENPWLTRDQAEAAIWRLTGIKNPVTVEQLLRVMDVYAASQGPFLIERLKERNRARQRWQIELPPHLPEGRVPQSLPEGGLTESHLKAVAAAASAVIELDDDEIGTAAGTDGERDPGADPAETFDFTKEADWPGKPAKAGPVWELPDGRMFQECSTCGTPKAYDEFHKDSNRWNGRSSRCKPCKNGSRTSTYKPRPGPPSHSWDRMRAAS